jgi:hypothetical protein
VTDHPHPSEGPEPQFGDAEVERILRRAAELDAADKARRGLTLPELEQIAAEAGIDPRHLAAAATPIGNPETSGAPSITGTTAPQFCIPSIRPRPTTTGGLR